MPNAVEVEWVLSRMLHDELGLLPNYRQHCAKRNAPVFKLLMRPILRFFAPQGRHVAPMG